jgi:hypothetical protein
MLDFVADGHDSVNVLASGVVEVPVLVPLAGLGGAGVAAAHGDHNIRALHRFGGQNLGSRGRNVDAVFTHGLNGHGVDLVCGL